MCCAQVISATISSPSKCWADTKMVDKPKITVASNHSIAILIVEQNLVQALSVAHRGYVLENGRIAMGGKAQDLLHDPDINAKYLGI